MSDKIAKIVDRAEQAEARAGRLQMRIDDDRIWKMRAQEAEALIDRFRDLRNGIDSARKSGSPRPRYSISRREVVDALDEILDTPGLRAVEVAP